MAYIAIPDPILFSRSLSDGSKLLYGLVKRYVDIGECFATNAHFAEVLNCSESSIKRCLRELVSQGHITSKVNRKGREITSRILSISGSVEVGSEMTLPCHSGRVRNDLKVGSEMTQIITEVNNRNKKILKNQNIGTHEQNLELDLQPPKKPRRKVNNSFTPGFEELWKQYPKRDGGNNKRLAFKAYCARLKEGVEHEQMLNGVKQYATHCLHHKKVQTEYVKMASSFLGTNRHFEDSWEIQLTDHQKKIKMMEEIFSGQC